MAFSHILGQLQVCKIFRGVALSVRRDTWFHIRNKTATSSKYLSSKQIQHSWTKKWLNNKPINKFVLLVWIKTLWLEPAVAHYCSQVQSPESFCLNSSVSESKIIFFLLSDTVLLTYKIYSDWSRIVIRINIWCPKCYHTNIDGEDRDLYVGSVLLLQSSYTSAIFLKIKQIRKKDWTRQYQNSFTWAELLREPFRKWKQ